MSVTPCDRDTSSPSGATPHVLKIAYRLLLTLLVAISSFSIPASGQSFFGSPSSGGGGANLGSEFSSSALRALRVIESDKESQRSEPNRNTLRAIEAAEAQAGSGPEKNVVLLMYSVFSQRSLDNSARKAGTAQGDGRSAACFSALSRALTSRSYQGTPSPCESWLSGPALAIRRGERGDQGGSETIAPLQPSGERFDWKEWFADFFSSRHLPEWMRPKRNIDFATISTRLILLLALVVVAVLRVVFTKHPMEGRLVIMHGGTQVAEVDFRTLQTDRYSVSESDSNTRVTTAEAWIRTGKDMHLFDLKMRRSGGKWLAYVIPMQGRLVDQGRIVGYGVMPRQRVITIDGSQLRFIYYHSTAR